MSARREEEAGPPQRKADGSDQRTGARAGNRQCDLCRHRRPTRGPADVLQALAQKR